MVEPNQKPSKYLTMSYMVYLNKQQKLAERRNRSGVAPNKLDFDEEDERD